MSRTGSREKSAAEIPGINDRKLFAEVLKKMIDITLQDGYGFPATEVTDEEREQTSTYVEGGLPYVFNTSRCTPEYMEEKGLTNDSKRNYGHVLIVPAPGEA